MDSSAIPALLAGAFFGVIIGALLMRSRSAAQVGELTAALGAERALAAERIALLGADQSRSQQVEALVEPVRASLTALSASVERTERTRASGHAELAEQLRLMARSSIDLRTETGRLVNALNRSEYRGHWGEAQLKRIVEAAGLIQGVHFVEQPTLVNGGSSLRPDMVITLSNDRKIVIDAKVSLDALLSTDDVDDHARTQRHAASVAAHIDQLAGKQYWRQFSSTPEFVVMFMPAESLLGTALQSDPGLLDRAFARNVVLATPSTLLALLRTVAMGWRDEALADNARAIHDLGRELHNRLLVLSGHLGKLGSSLDGAVASYNKAVGSWEGRVLVTARRMAELGTASEPLPEVVQIDRTARSIAGVAAAAGGAD